MEGEFDVSGFAVVINDLRGQFVSTHQRVMNEIG